MSRSTLDRQLGEALDRLRRLARRGPLRPPVRIAPDSVFEAVLDQRVGELERQVSELRARQFGLLAVIVGGVAVDVFLRVSAGF